MIQQVLVVVLVALAFSQQVRTENGVQENHSNMSAQNGAQATENHSNRGSDQPTVLSVDQYILQLNSKLDTLNSKLELLDTNLSQHKQQTAAELAQLQTSLTNTQSSLATHTQQVNTLLSLLTTSFSQLAQLHTSLNNKLSSTNSKLDALMASTAQLSLDHQEIQSNISNMECRDADNHQRFTCGGTEGWRRVVYLDFTDPSTACPSGWQLTGYSKRTCGRARPGSFVCDSVFFPVSGGEYSKVCGRIKAYQWGSPDAFFTQTAPNINTVYVNGVSVTHGNPRQHIWTFAAGLSEDTSVCPQCACPCDSTNAVPAPPFVGEDYFCESGLHERWVHRQYVLFPNDPLWDGQDCTSTSTCCSLHNPPYFIKQLPSSAADSIEARICLNQGNTDENIAVELVELYVQ